MKKKVFLEHIMTKDRLLPNVINLIESPPGSGKTHWILKKLIHEYPDKRRILYLIDSKSGNLQLVKNNADCAFYDELWRWNANRVLAFEKDFLPDKVVVMTYHKLAYLLYQGKALLYNFDVVICDEIHNLHKFQTYYKKGQVNVLNLAQFWIDMALNDKELRNPELRIVALTATPDRLYKMFPPTIVNKVLTDEELKTINQYTIAKEETYPSIDNVIADLPTRKGIIYVQRITKMKEYAEKIKEKHGGLNVQMIWSLNNEKHSMNETQHGIWETILNNERVPSDIDILFINASCETCVNITSPTDFMVIDSWDEDVKKQVRGRYRDNLDLCFYPSGTPTYIYVPNYYLDTPLFLEDTQAMCKEINYKQSKKLMMFPTISKMLLDTGDYDIRKTDRCQKNYRNRPYYEISLTVS